MLFENLHIVLTKRSKIPAGNIGMLIADKNGNCRIIQMVNRE